MEAIADICEQMVEWSRAQDPDDFCMFLGGDHSMAMGSIAGLGQHHRTGVLWVDAHTDINTPESSPSGNIHGMPIAHLLGMGHPRLTGIWGDQAIIRPEDIVYVGIRSVDSRERKICKELGIKTFTIQSVDRKGMANVVEESMKHLSHLSRVHLSFDADVLDPGIAPGVGTPVPGGLTYREAHLLMEMLCDSQIVTSMDLVEVNPILDIQNQTAQLVVDLTCSLLGQQIL